MRMTALVAACVLSACGASTQTQNAEDAHADGATAHWDAQLIALMPAIDACIAQSPETRWVSYAGEIEPDVTIVRLQGGEASVDCRVRAGAATIAPRDESLSIDGENAAIFVRGPGDNPGGACYDAPEMRSADGVLLGWMIDPEGC